MDLHAMLINLCILVLTIIITWVGGVAIHNSKLANALKTNDMIIQFAKVAVATAEKLGIMQNLTGSEKFKEAVNYVQKMLADNGITKVDIEQIQHAVESAYAQEKEVIEKAYAKSDKDTNKNTDNTPVDMEDGKSVSKVVSDSVKASK